MEQTRNVTCRVRRLSPSDGHYFFGYYDVAAWTQNEQYHLCHKVGFADRLPEAQDVAVLGSIRVSDGEFTPFAETTAWNFQQGSMLHWLPGSSSGEVVFNRRSGEDYVGVIGSIKTGAERCLDRAVAAVSPTGRHALSINFSRLFGFRPGYGYAGLPDPFANEPYPANDGLFLIDTDSGRSKLILPLSDIHRMFPEQTEGQELLINHVGFNTDGTRALCLARNNPHGAGRWLTALLTLDLSGDNVFCLHGWGLVSHYNWRDPEHLLCYCNPAGEPGLFLLRDLAGSFEIADRDFFRADGHCSYSPDRLRILYDGYPSAEGYRPLYVYDIPGCPGRTVGEFLSPQPANHDIRCDLHPRWSPSGRFVSFDSTHEGFRGLYVMDLANCTSKEC